MNYQGDERAHAQDSANEPRGFALDLLILSPGDLKDPVVREMLRDCVILYDGLRIAKDLPCRNA